MSVHWDLVGCVCGLYSVLITSAWRSAKITDGRCRSSRTDGVRVASPSRSGVTTTRRSRRASSPRRCTRSTTSFTAWPGRHWPSSCVVSSSSDYRHAVTSWRCAADEPPRRCRQLQATSWKNHFDNSSSSSSSATKMTVLTATISTQYRPLTAAPKITVLVLVPPLLLRVTMMMMMMMMMMLMTIWKGTRASAKTRSHSDHIQHRRRATCHRQRHRCRRRRQWRGQVDVKDFILSSRRHHRRSTTTVNSRTSAVDRCRRATAPPS